MIVNEMFGTVRGKNLAILGFSFKKDTSDTRDSPAIYVARYFVLKMYSHSRALKAEGARLFIYDPEVTEKDILSSVPGVLVR